VSRIRPRPCRCRHTCRPFANSAIQRARRYGRLGHGDENRQNAPKVVEGKRRAACVVCDTADTLPGLSGKSISFIACGGFHTAAITDRGALYVSQLFDQNRAPVLILAMAGTRGAEATLGSSVRATRRIKRCPAGAVAHARK
jgi:hypothetical protein